MRNGARCKMGALSSPIFNRSVLKDVARIIPLICHVDKGCFGCHEFVTIKPWPEYPEDPGLSGLYVQHDFS